MRGVTDMVGKSFGWLTVVAEAGRDAYGNILWTCRCECGETYVARGFALRNGETKGCGCQRGRFRKRSNKAVVHDGVTAQAAIDDFLYHRPPPTPTGDWLSRFTCC